MQEINIILPNQLFEKSQLLENNCETFLLEEHLFFSQYKFHKQKIYFHRSSMLNYFDFLENKGIKTNYVNSYESESDIRVFLEKISADSQTGPTIV